jgi:hypothetical protein
LGPTDFNERDTTHFRGEGVPLPDRL